MAIIPYNNLPNNFNFNDISQTPLQDRPPEGISMLPQDVLIQICHHLGILGILEIKEICRLASTQRKFYFLASSNATSNPLWKSLFYNNYDDFNYAPDEIKNTVNGINFYKLYKCLTEVILDVERRKKNDENALGPFERMCNTKTNGKYANDIKYKKTTTIDSEKKGEQLRISARADSPSYYEVFVTVYTSRVATKFRFIKSSSSLEPKQERDRQLQILASIMEKRERERELQSL